MPEGYVEESLGASNTTDSAGGDSSETKEKSTGTTEGGDSQAAADGEDNGKQNISSYYKREPINLNCYWQGSLTPLPYFRPAYFGTYFPGEAKKQEGCVGSKMDLLCEPQCVRSHGPTVYPSAVQLLLISRAHSWSRRTQQVGLPWKKINLTLCHV